MAQDRVADKEQLIAEAWARWREADYSWEGLLDPRKETEGFESRQHYWRTDPETGEVRDDAALMAAGELIIVEGQKTYHLAHLPLHYADGTPTAKTTTDTAEALHERLTALIVTRLKAASTDEAPVAMLHGLVAGGTLDLSADRINHHLRACFDLAILADARFRNATFSGKASFDRATFSGNARFLSATFSDFASFINATFSGFASFWETSFDKDIVFAYAHFHKIARFRLKTWPQMPSGYHKAFFSTTFHELADFTGSGFQAFGAFDGARFLGGLRLDKAEKIAVAQNRADFETQARETFDGELEAILAVEDPETEEAKAKYPKSRKVRRKLTNAKREEMLEQLEGGCRTLKLEMERQGDKNREQLLYKFELLARRAQESTPGFEKFLSRRYEQFADYGANAFKPITGLFGLWVLCIPIFGLFHLDMDAIIALFESGQAADFQAWLSLLATVPSNLVEAASVSASRIFPFGAFEDVSKDFATSLGQPYLKLIFRLLATFESFLALTLAFLFGLAVRRRFQIS